MRKTTWCVGMQVVGMTLVALLFAGCSKPTEEQRLAKFRGSLKVKALPELITGKPTAQVGEGAVGSSS